MTGRVRATRVEVEAGPRPPEPRPRTVRIRFVIDTPARVTFLQMVGRVNRPAIGPEAVPPIGAPAVLTGDRHADAVLRLLRRDGEVSRERIKSLTGLRRSVDLDRVERVLVEADLAELVAIAPARGFGRRRRVMRLRPGNGRAVDARKSSAGRREPE